MRKYGMKMFEPIELGPVHLKNRIMMAPCVTFFAKEGHVTDQMIDYYRERAKGGAAMIVVEATYPCLSGRSRRLHLFDDTFIPGLKRLTDTIHEENAKVALQLNPSAGIVAENEALYVSVPKGAPAGAKELAEDKIEEIIRQFGEGCEKASEANFDAVQIHGSSGYLVHQFLSPAINKRKDRYGGELKNRAMFALALVREARKKTGEKMAMLFRICADDHMAGGIGPLEAKQFAVMLQEAGIDSIDVTSGTFETSEYLRPGMQFPKCINLDYAKEIKDVVSIPVSVAGSMNTPFAIEEALKEGGVDVVALGRPLIADPFFVNKVAEDEISDINKCILCNQGCTEYTMIKKRALMCTVNPLVGREGECSLPKAKRNQKVLVVGGGPAGLLAAVSAAKKGHHVTIMEKKGELGGNLVAASGVFFKREIAQLQLYLIRQVERSGAHIGVGVEVDSSLINEIQPDVLILATGAVAAMPSIPGIGKSNVTDMIDVLSGRNWNIGGRAIVVGGGMFACETAVFLKARGNDVVMVSVHGPEKLALGMESRLRRWFILDLWPKMGIPLYSHSQLQEVVNEGLVIRHMKWGGRTTLLEGEKVIFAMNLKKDNSLISALRNSSAGVGIHLIGDCVRPRSILEAIREGYDVGTSI